MNNDIRINRRQFIIRPEPYNKSDDHWKTIKMENDLYLSHCKTLPVKKVLDKNKSEIYLIGLAVQTDKNKEDPVEELKKSTGELNELYKSWAGR